MPVNCIFSSLLKVRQASTCQNDHNFQFCVPIKGIIPFMKSFIRHANLLIELFLNHKKEKKIIPGEMCFSNKIKQSLAGYVG